MISNRFLRVSSKNLSSEEVPVPMSQNYLLPTAFAIIFTLKPKTDIGTRSPRPSIFLEVLDRVFALVPETNRNKNQDLLITKCSEMFPGHT